MPSKTMINPLTNRKIKIGGPTHMKLTKEVRSLKRSLKKTPKSRLAKRSKLRSLIRKSQNREGRGSRTRGWSAMSPQRGKERHMLFEKCGKKCFLEPKNEAFPICAAIHQRKGCKPDCKGILSAKIRARQYKHDDIARLAERLEKKFCL
jgi:hypothetical protein